MYLDEIRADGCDGAAIFRFFHTGPGSDSLRAAAGHWRAAAGSYLRASDSVAGALRQAMASWTGASASRAEEAMDPFDHIFWTGADSAALAADAIDAQA